MSDTYLNLVNSGLTKEIAKKLGLPRPAVLRRFDPSKPLVPGPLLVLGKGESADALASVLLSWQQDVRRHATPKEKLGAILMVLDEVMSPEDLSSVSLDAGASLRDLASGGRIVTVSRPASEAQDPAAAAARQGVEGTLRSLAHELRGGATANGIVLANGTGATAPSVAAALRFLLSGRSAYVNGQFITVGSAAGELPAEWTASLAAKTAVVTGAARGIGAAIARVLHREGANVIVVDVPAAGEQLAAVANEIRGTALQVDITRDDAADRILAHASERYGRLDIVIHNAGITRDKLLANMDASRWDSVIAVNIASQLKMNERFLASEAFSKQGRIVSLASTSGIAGNRGQTNYAASKAGIIGMVRATAPLLEPRGGSINAVAPGFIETDMTARMPALTRQVARRLSSLQQGGQPVDVAETIAFLASDGAAGVNGQVLRVCGQNMVGA
ncbi:3-oxoacyl-ACP reductase [Arthrobacter caoxuetaonis]|uniref:3-oxoacyl-ACP reductase n=1 Tax=Arthrobacter caoxuetaonis TaxID=2886935 RepID=A0A9X1SDJ9_9MICC|nr:3-oxoacyl-ACP reductase [Arthrobacter caoxuetaonis]MCC3298811.1 3-oxoacyl-ACP reductase [Arthrobacter caoxuetaonis]USQ55839.1 3-oxoacyl-ACP reductase [Arthrobacter caoxuetaonis]